MWQLEAKAQYKISEAEYLRALGILGQVTSHANNF